MQKRLDKYSILCYNIYRKEGRALKLKEKIKELSEIVAELEKLTVRIVSWLGWLLYLIHILKQH